MVSLKFILVSLFIVISVSATTVEPQPPKYGLIGRGHCITKDLDQKSDIRQKCSIIDLYEKKAEDFSFLAAWKSITPGYLKFVNFFLKPLPELFAETDLGNGDLKEIFKEAWSNLPYRFDNSLFVANFNMTDGVFSFVNGYNKIDEFMSYVVREEGIFLVSDSSINLSKNHWRWPQTGDIHLQPDDIIIILSKFVFHYENNDFFPSVYNIFDKHKSESRSISDPELDDWVHLDDQHVEDPTLAQSPSSSSSQVARYKESIKITEEIAKQIGKLAQSSFKELFFWVYRVVDLQD